MKKNRNIIIFISLVVLGFLIIIFSAYKIGLGKVSDNNELIIVKIDKGSVKDIADTLEENNLIKSKLSFIVYVKLHKKNNLQAATYQLSEDMGVKKIVEKLQAGDAHNPNDISLTLREGKNIREFVNIVSSLTSYSEEEVYSLISNEEYLNELIDTYWFLTDDIKASEIYYPLEGYLFPNTHYFEKDVELKTILTTFLDEMEKKLEPFKSDIYASSMSVHEIITLASIVEVEGITLENRKAIAQVFYNRLDKGISLGSDVTTYYGAKIDDFSHSLTAEELNDCSNGYNTRCLTFKELPVGPINNPSIEAIETVLNPDGNNDYYFVADCDNKIYLSKDLEEHNKTIRKLKKEDKWCD